MDFEYENSEIIRLTDDNNSDDNWFPEFSGSDISCGVAQAFDLPTNYWIKKQNKKYGKATVIKAYKKWLNAIKQEGGYAFVLLSHNVEEGRMNNSILKKICSTTTNARLNKNSSNKIRVYIF